MSSELNMNSIDYTILPPVPPQQQEIMYITNQSEFIGYEEVKIL